MKDIFKKTCIPNISSAIKETFTENNADAIYIEACDILEHELKNVDDRGNKAIGIHLRFIILPGFACYKALLNSGIHQEEAIDFLGVTVPIPFGKHINGFKVFSNISKLLYLLDKTIISFLYTFKI